MERPVGEKLPLIGRCCLKSDTSMVYIEEKRPYIIDCQ